MELTTDRLLLRDFVPEDWQAVLAYQSDPLYLRYYHWTHRTEADVRAFVHRFITQQQENPRKKFQLALILKDENRLIGNCGVRMDDTENRQGNIGYELDSRYWNRGYATEAASTMLRFGFEALKLHRIWACCVAENIGSWRVMEKLGMRWEGCEREKEFIQGAWRDQLLYALLDHEWRSCRF